MCPGCEITKLSNDHQCHQCDDDETNNTLINDDKQSVKRVNNKKKRDKIKSTVDSGATIHCIKDKPAVTS